MPTFYERGGGGTPYVKGHMDGAFCKWQVTEECAAQLRSQGYSTGDEISQRYVNRLVARGDLYTGGSGVTEFMERKGQGVTAGAPPRKPRKKRKRRKKPRFVLIVALAWMFLAVIVSLIWFPFWLLDFTENRKWTQSLTHDVKWLWNPENWKVKMTNSDHKEWVQANIGCWVLVLIFASCASCVGLL